jgi:uncharacterized protein (DUF1778 family)
MSETVTIRLNVSDRKTLESAAREQGKGLSAFVHQIVETEARRMQRVAIRADGEQVVAYLAEHPQARDELDQYGTPRSGLP